MKKIFPILILLSVLFSCNNSVKTRIQLSLNNNWEFKATDDSLWLSAEVPGVVHLDLLSHQIIPDPFDSTNETQLQWIGKKNWEYKLEFNSDTLENFQNIDLVFEGLDTYADIYLNGLLIQQANNMYRIWKIPIKSNIQEGKNILKIIFYAPDKKNRKKAKSLAYTLPDERAFSRKAPYQFGWDWGAKFLTSGIWKNVYLDLWNELKISDIQVIQNTTDSLNARLTARININSSVDEAFWINIYNSDSLITKQKLQVSKGENIYDVDFEINNPRLWWCNGMGEPHLYNLKFELLKAKTIIDKKTETIGIRTIELIQEPDSIGKSFYFKLNGKPVFVKGANFVPTDNFLPRVTEQNYRGLIEEAVWANFNMLRVWGGGIYESDDFYNLCDEKGILVWQDFMYSCTMYPGDSNFISTAEKEAIDQIIRLRNHPSLAIWCGNNEVDNGWKDWGWQQQFKYSQKDSSEIWQNYLHLFEEILPRLLETYDGTRNYHPSSPTYGWGHKENFTQGDSHYWGVWWGHEPFEIFNTKVGRFMSEYGFQALPNIKSIQQFADSTELYISSASMKAHQKHPTGFETIDEYLNKEYKTTRSFEDYIYLSQLAQAYGITTAIEAHRRAKPYCMGTLYWQLNDAWPVTSWSSIDYYGRRKALHYFVKEAYKPIIISTIAEKDSLSVYVISDLLESENLTINISYQNFNGKALHTEKKQITVNNNSQIVYKIPIQSKDLQNSFLYINLFKNEKLIDDEFYYFVKPKELHLPKANINIKIKGTSITLQSDILAKNLELISNLEGSFSDNYFDLLPNEKKEITFNPSEKGKLRIEYRVLNNLY